MEVIKDDPSILVYRYSNILKNIFALVLTDFREKFSH